MTPVTVISLVFALGLGLGYFFAIRARWRMIAGASALLVATFVISSFVVQPTLSEADMLRTTLLSYVIAMPMIMGLLGGTLLGWLRNRRHPHLG